MCQLLFSNSECFVVLLNIFVKWREENSILNQTQSGNFIILGNMLLNIMVCNGVYNKSGQETKSITILIFLK